MPMKKSIFPHAVQPPKLVQPYGPQLGYVAAAICIVFAVIHLFRIDTLLPLVHTLLPGGSAAAATFVIAVVCAEVFAVPFLLRMKLSPLAHISSGFLAIVAPLMWTLFAIWSYGQTASTGQLGQFVHLPSTILLIVLDLLWLALNFFALWTLGYNNLHLQDILGKKSKK